MRIWLYAIMRNLLVDMARARASRPWTSPAVPDVPAADELDGLLGSLAVAEALRRLSPEHRQVIVQNYVTQRPQSEIAEFLGVPVGTVRSRLFYRAAALSRALAEDRSPRAGARRRACCRLKHPALFPQTSRNRKGPQ